MITDEDLKAASRDELLEVKGFLDGDIQKITTDLQVAGVKRRTEGVYSDPIWYQKATFAKRIKGMLSQRIQTELGRKKRLNAEVNRNENESRLSTRLMQAMTIVLTPEQKKIVIETANSLR